jgi:hypothetical protein
MKVLLKIIKREFANEGEEDFFSAVVVVNI